MSEEEQVEDTGKKANPNNIFVSTGQKPTL
jgi:hypothetical protein